MSSERGAEKKRSAGYSEVSAALESQQDGEEHGFAPDLIGDLGPRRRNVWSRPKGAVGCLLLAGALVGLAALARPALLTRSCLGSSVAIDAAEDQRCGLMEDSMEYRGDLLTSHPDVEDAGACCVLCQESPRCRLWTWAKREHACDLRSIEPSQQMNKAVNPDVVSGLPFQWSKYGSLFCFALMQPRNYERGLIQMQYTNRWGVFACDEYAIYSNEEIKIAPGVVTSVVDSDLKCTTGGEFKTALNMEIFMAVWDKAIADGRYKYNDWTVKVDPDCVFFPERLQVALAFHPDTYDGLYLNNCRFGLHGPIEVFSLRAVDAWGAGSERCVAHFRELCSGDCLWGEDMFIDQCLSKVLQVHRDDDWNLLSEPHCASDDWEDCDNHRVAFHPFKDTSGFTGCVKKARYGALPTPN